MSNNPVIVYSKKIRAPFFHKTVEYTRYIRKISSVIFLSLKRLAAEASDVNENKVALWDLYRRPIMRIISFNTLFCWFTVAMVFYGLALNGGNLSGLFLSLFTSET